MRRELQYYLYTSRIDRGIAHLPHIFDACGYDQAIISSQIFRNPNNSNLFAGNPPYREVRATRMYYNLLPIGVTRVTHAIPRVVRR